MFIYLHIQFHLKKGEDLEMYEVEQPSKDKLEEICDLRQPVLFDFECDKIMQSSNRDYLTAHYHAFELKIRNVQDNNPESELYIPLPLHAAIKLFHEDKSATYFSENNTEFLEETGVIKHYKYNDDFLRPYMVSNCNYDLLVGSSNTYTPFRYEINYRNYILLTQGSAKIKLAPPQSIKYLYPIYDYENFEFRSPVNPWNPQPKYIADFDKMKCLEFTLLPGKTLYIPAYWWYSIQFGDNTSIACFHYRTYMNNAAILPYICLHALQLQNVKRNVVKKASISELNTQSPLPLEQKEHNVTNTPSINKNPSSLNNELPINHNEPTINHTIKESLPQPISANELIGSEI